MIGIIRYLKGYVKIRVTGYAPERFMNLCTNRRIILWGLSGYGGCYVMYMSLSDFFSIRDIVRKTKTRVAVLERYGLPFLLQDVGRRKMFAAGVLGCLLFLLWMSRFVWAIEFQGNLMVSDDELSNFLKAQGVHYGVPKSSLNLGSLEASLRETFPQITWTSARIDGTKITLQVRENDLPTEEEQKESASRFPEGADLIAAKSGVVVSILTRSGVPMVKAGDQVEKGTVLISGLVPVTNDDGTVREWESKTADGTVVLSCREPVRLTQQLAYRYKDFTGRQKNYRFFTLGSKRYRFPLGNCDFLKYDEVVEEERLQLFGQIDLPVFTGTICQREYLPVDAKYDENTAAMLLSGKLEKIIAGLEEKGVQIIQKDVKIVRKADALVLEGSLLIRQEAVFLQAARLPDEPETQTQTP